MLARVISGALIGIDAYPVEVEVDIAQGLPQFSTVGLPEGAVRESKDRVKSAIKNSGYEFPVKRITINLAPADIKKDGAAFDLPMAIGILTATGLVRPSRAASFVFMGELSLDGRIKPVRGALPVAVAARSWEVEGLILPRENAAEGAIVGSVPSYGLRDLGEVVDFLNGAKEIEPCRIDINDLFGKAAVHAEDFAEVRGQEHVKRALEVAAAGSHNILRLYLARPIFRPHPGVARVPFKMVYKRSFWGVEIPFLPKLQKKNGPPGCWGEPLSCLTKQKRGYTPF